MPLYKKHVHRTGTPLSPGTGSGSISAVGERMASESSPGDVGENSGFAFFFLEAIICN